MEFTIRPIAEKDNKELADLIRIVFREFKIDMPGTVYTDPTTDDLFHLFEKEGSAYLVAEENGKILGGCGIYPTDKLPQGCAELVKFYLSADARGQGLGFKLLEASMSMAKELGYTQLYLESFPSLTKAISMYEKIGFTRIPTAMGNSGHFACNVWMLKDLTETSAAAFS